MSEWAEDQDPYEVLGLSQRHESSEAEIKKAYRLLALKKHPDKQPNNPNAAAEFHPIQRAFDVLTDSKARAALDDLHRAKAARKAREAGQSEKRRKMREDLEKRENSYQTARNDEQRARNKLKEELDRLRKQAAERRAKNAAEVSLAFAQASAHPHLPPREPTASATEYEPAAPQQASVPNKQLTEELLRTLKVSWDKQGISQTYTADDLRRIMGAHGVVEDVVFLAEKKKKAKALVVMQTLESAITAAEAVNGTLTNPLLVVPFAKAAASSAAAPTAPQRHDDMSPEAYASVQPPQPQQQSQSHESQPAFPISKPSTTPTPPSSPNKDMPLRNPFGGVYHAPPSATFNSQVPAFAAASTGPQAGFSSQAPAFAAVTLASQAHSNGGRPAVAAAASVPQAYSNAKAPAFAAGVKPLFAAGAGDGAQFGSDARAGPFGATNGSYSSFPGGFSAPSSQADLGRNHVAHTVQAGMKRAFEDATLLKLRQAADRARAIQQLQTEDADQSHSDS